MTCLGAKIGSFYHQRVSIPVAARITVPLHDTVVQLWTAIYWDDSDIVDHFNIDRHKIFVLDYLIRIVVSRRNRRYSVIGDTAIPVGAVKPRVSRVFATVSCFQSLLCNGRFL